MLIFMKAKSLVYCGNGVEISIIKIYMKYVRIIKLKGNLHSGTFFLNFMLETYKI